MVIVFYNKITYALFSLQFMKTDKINLHVCDDFSSKELGDKNHFHFAFIGTSLVAQKVRNLPATQEIEVQSLGQ